VANKGNNKKGSQLQSVSKKNLSRGDYNCSICGAKQFAFITFQ